mmetsp:Transcript_95800/g.275038  ORF Transcript_95800/g.275038 Transcript_95800/m.275038 type:complete len:282 (+) Transcript_95800:155-1000(+)
MVLPRHVVELDVGEVGLAMPGHTFGGDEVVVVRQAHQGLSVGISPQHPCAIRAVPAKHRVLGEDVSADQLPEDHAQHPPRKDRQKRWEQHSGFREDSAFLRRAEREAAADFHTLQEADRVDEHRLPRAARRALVAQGCQVGRQRMAHHIVAEVGRRAEMSPQHPCQRICIVRNLRQAFQIRPRGGHARQFEEDATSSTPLRAALPDEERQVREVAHAKTVQEDDRAPVRAQARGTREARLRQIGPAYELALWHWLGRLPQAQGAERHPRSQLHRAQEEPNG